MFSGGDVDQGGPTHQLRITPRTPQNRFLWHGQVIWYSSSDLPWIAEFFSIFFFCASLGDLIRSLLVSVVFVEALLCRSL